MKFALPQSAQAWRRANALRPGDRVAVIAPSGPLPEERFFAGAELLAQRYELCRAPGLLDKQGFLAGSDGRRLAELRWALSDPTVRAVFAGRGGHGLLRLVNSLAAILRSELRPLPLIGFSDITVLHAFAARHLFSSIHGPVVTQLPLLPAEDVKALWALLEHPAPPPPLLGLQPVGPIARERIEGRLLGGNLEVLSRLCGTPFAGALRPGEPVVLLLEEVAEAPYRIDRALTQLLLSSVLADVQAFVVGDLTRCDPPSPDSQHALEVIAERAAQLGAVVVAGAPVGHGARNRPLPLGARVTLEPRAGRLIFHDGAVA